MNRMKQLLMLLGVCIILAACDNSLARAIRTVGLIQEDTTAILNDLNEIQTLETDLQKTFESDLAKNDLALFNTDNSDVIKNVNRRQEIMQDIEKRRKSLGELSKELGQLGGKQHLPSEQFQTIVDGITALDADLSVYASDYTSSLALESTSFKSIANPQSDYTAFFEVLKNVNTLSITNHINLDKVIPHFEQLNINLVNLKVELVKMQESKK